MFGSADRALAGTTTGTTTTSMAAMDLERSVGSSHRQSPARAHFYPSKRAGSGDTTLWEPPGRAKRSGRFDRLAPALRAASVASGGECVGELLPPHLVVC